MTLTISDEIGFDVYAGSHNTPGVVSREIMAELHISCWDSYPENCSDDIINRIKRDTKRKLMETIYGGILTRLHSIMDEASRSRDGDFGLATLIEDINME